MDDNHEPFMDDCPPPDQSVDSRLERRTACQIHEPPVVPLITPRTVGTVAALAIVIVVVIAAVETFT